MNLGQTFELNIERMSFGPKAIGRFLPETSDPSSRPMVVFIENCAPGDRVKAKLTKKQKKFWEAELVEVLTPSKTRQNPPCPIFNTCGGCQWQHLNYDTQIEQKKAILLHQLKRATKTEISELEKVTEIHLANSEFGYRTRVQVHGDNTGIGFFELGSKKLAKTGKCAITHHDIQKAWERFCSTQPLDKIKKEDGFFKVEFTRTAPNQVLEAVNKKNAAFGFTQVNPEQNKVLQKIVSNIAEKNEKKEVLLDLYGGDGNLSSAIKFKKIICVDSYNSGEKLDGNEFNKPFNLIKSRIEDFLEKTDLKEIDCLIADPPRTGLKTTLDGILKLGAHNLILVSCDPATLSRDLEKVLKNNYKIDEIHLVDMFPQTYHIEAVVALS